MCEPTTILAALGSGGAAAGTTAAATTAAAGATTAAASTAASTAAAMSTAQLAIQGVTAFTKANAAVAQADAQNRAYIQNAQSAKDAYFLKSKQANLRILQEQTQASQQKQDADLKALRSQGTAMAAAASSGVQGVDVDRLVQDFERSEGVLADRINQRLEGMQAQNEMQKLAFQSEAQNRINSMQPANFAETMFNVIEPIAGFGIDYLDTKSRLADLEG